MNKAAAVAVWVLTILLSAVVGGLVGDPFIAMVAGFGIGFVGGHAGYLIWDAE